MIHFRSCFTDSRSGTSVKKSVLYGGSRCYSDTMALEALLLASSVSRITITPFPSIDYKTINSLNTQGDRPLSIMGSAYQCESVQLQLCFPPRGWTRLARDTASFYAPFRSRDSRVDSSVESSNVSRDFPLPLAIRFGDHALRFAIVAERNQERWRHQDDGSKGWKTRETDR